MSVKKSDSDIKNIQNYLNSNKKLNKKDLFIFIVFSFFIALLGVLQSDNKFVKIFIFIVYAIMMIVYVFKIQKKNLNSTQLCRFYGCFGLVSAFVYGTLGAVQVETIDKSLMMIFCVLISDLFVIILLELYFRRIIKGKVKTLKFNGVATGLIGTGAVCGILLSRILLKNNVDIKIELIFVLFSIIFSFFYGYIIKGRFYKYLQNTENSSFDY